MCTAISDHTYQHLFGRTLDVECSYGESVVIAPRQIRFDLLYEIPIQAHLAVIGIGCVRGNTPLYYDAVNEAGLAMAGLNFPQNAVYHPKQQGKHNVASYELIPWVLYQCKTVREAAELLSRTNITPDNFSSDLTATPLHWIIADKERAVTVESVSNGLCIYENRFGVLTNEPPFPYHETRLADFMQLRAEYPQNGLCPSTDLSVYSRGMGAMGLPGDFSSPSRFVRAVFLKNHTAHEASEEKAVGRFFHIMDSVCVPRGCVKTEEGKEMLTRYTSCANTDTATYYFTTYHRRRIRTVDLRSTPLDADTLTQFSILDGEDG